MALVPKFCKRAENVNSPERIRRNSADLGIFLVALGDPAWSHVGMATPVEQSPSVEIKQRLESVIRYLHAVAGPDDEMLKALVRRLERMTAPPEAAGAEEARTTAEGLDLDITWLFGTSPSLA